MRAGTARCQRKPARDNGQALQAGGKRAAVSVLSYQRPTSRAYHERAMAGSVVPRMMARPSAKTVN